MSTTIPSKITVQVDTREQYPLLFPKHVYLDDPSDMRKRKLVAVTVENIKLDTGDYRLKEYPECCVIERKGSPEELYKNLFSADTKRQGASLQRLSAVQYPYLMIEGTPANYLTTNPRIMSSQPESLMHRLSMVIPKYNLNVIWVTKPSTPTARRNLGTAVVHILLGCAVQQLIGSTNEVRVVPGVGSSA